MDRGSWIVAVAADGEPEPARFASHSEHQADLSADEGVDGIHEGVAGHAAAAICQVHEPQASAQRVQEVGAGAQHPCRECELIWRKYGSWQECPIPTMQ